MNEKERQAESLTIEERADKAMRQRSADYLQPLSYEFKNGYVKGATEQVRIDEEEMEVIREAYRIASRKVLARVFNIITEEMGRACGTALIKQISEKVKMDINE